MGRPLVNQNINPNSTNQIGQENQRNIYTPENQFQSKGQYPSS